MTTDQIDAVVFKDQAGEYYLLPQALLERSRVSAEAKATIEMQVPPLQALRTAGDDVQGHHPMIIGAAAGIAVTLFGLGIGNSMNNNDNLGPLLQEFISKYQ
ncbi:MAG: hypothetical protein ACRDJE_05655 [Dehalococcoidia bacterium]